MKNYIFLSVLWICASVSSYGQGVFAAHNATASTRLGSLDGAFAGTNIVGQMLAGLTASSLHPVGMINFHVDGRFSAGLISVPDVPAYQYAYVQLLAWEGTYWGSSLAGVPNDQLGRTDIVTVFLTTAIFPDPYFAPLFTQPAIVPPIPEPATLALAIIGFGLLALRRRQKI